MSQFNYLNEINNVLTMDGDLSRCPAPRWQKKILDASSSSILNASINTSKLSISYNNGLSALAASMSNKTPQKNGGNSGGTTNKGKKTTPGRKVTTPDRQNKTPGGGDRFIPNRATSNFDIGHYKVKMDQQNDNGGSGGGGGGGSSEAQNSNQGSGDSNVAGGANNDDHQPATQQQHQLHNQNERQMLMNDVMQVGDVNQRRIFSFKDKAPAAPEFHQNPLRVVYSVNTPMTAKSSTRYIPNSPERILDAPDIINDYYLNLMDWSTDNVVTVALGRVVYLWNAATGNIEQLREYDVGDHACSLAWIQEGHILAIGNNQGTVELWDCEKKKRLRVMDGHSARVGALAWNSFMVSSGSRDGSIIHHDVRQREHCVTTLTGHTQEVCGLKWSPDFKYLASGGNDNLVNVWSSATSGRNANETVHVFNQHQAAVRALAWCPWQQNTLATGGGTADRCIKFWNVNNGALINSVDTKSQVCALLWSTNYKELISAHGYANNQLTIWKYPSMVKQAELTGHTSRVLQIAMSPDGSTVMSAAADETLRLWNCFAPDPHQTKKEKGSVNSKPSLLKQSIR